MGIATIAAVDYASGVELRTYPLYYLPISAAAWAFGRRGALAASASSAAGWLASNHLAGLEFSHPWIWAANTAVQAASFAVVGLLVARLNKALQRERNLSRHDPLCGILNSRAFYEDGERVLSRCRLGGRPATLVYVDVDRFKDINDVQGHKTGDRLLCSVAESLRSHIRANDVAARLGGDEFVVLLPELGPAEAETALGRLHASLAQKLGEGVVTVSMGAFSCRTPPPDLKSMVQAADAAMYEAKRQGGNRCQLSVS